MAAALLPLWGHAGNQIYEPLADSVRQRLSAMVSDQAPARLHFRSPEDGQRWIDEMEKRLAPRMPERQSRMRVRWVPLLGQPNHNLFPLRTNLAYGCAILRHYLDMERGDYFRALGRYNGTLGRPEYPNLVLGAWKGRWKYDGPAA